jgi:hypothetical protein
MFARYLWTAGGKSRSLLPGGAFLYEGLSRIVNANGRATAFARGG